MPIAPARPCLVSTCPERQPCPVHATVTRRRRGLPDKHRWYHWARWHHPIYGLRTKALERCPFCLACAREGRIQAAVDVDHVIPHRGDPSRFWDLTNLEGLCKMHHSRKTGQGQ
jgi:5-methylcytosine-specific restriction enzyme A